MLRSSSEIKLIICDNYSKTNYGYIKLFKRCWVKLLRAWILLMNKSLSKSCKKYYYCPWQNLLKLIRLCHQINETSRLNLDHSFFPFTNLLVAFCWFLEIAAKGCLLSFYVFINQRLSAQKDTWRIVFIRCTQIVSIYMKNYDSNNIHNILSYTSFMFWNSWSSLIFLLFVCRISLYYSDMT